jgi:hypothetical protein
VERRVVALPIERILDTGWLDLAELRRFVDEAERLGVDGPVRLWWFHGPEDEPPRLEVVKEIELDEGSGESV